MALQDSHGVGSPCVLHGKALLVNLAKFPLRVTMTMRGNGKALTGPSFALLFRDAITQGPHRGLVCRHHRSVHLRMYALGER